MKDLIRKIYEAGNISGKTDDLEFTVNVWAVFIWLSVFTVGYKFLVFLLTL